MCDPPYGIRVRSKKAKYSNTESTKDTFDIDEIYQSLLNMGAENLKPGGRLVFLFHTDMVSKEEASRFPEHPALSFVDSSENELTKNRVRHCITLQKNS